MIVSAVLFFITAAAALPLCRNKGVFLMLFLLFVFCLRAVTVMSWQVSYSKHIDGAKDSINATVVTSPLSVGDENFGYCTVRVDSSKNGVLNKGDRVYLYAEGVVNCEIGDTVKADVTFSAFDENTEESFYSDGIFYKAQSESKVIHNGKGKGVYALAGSVRSYIGTHIKSNSSNYHILLSVITGERCYVSDELYGRVIDAGVSHVLVVSGMHLVLLCGGLERILRLLMKNNVVRGLVVIVFVAFMSVICGFGMSIMRAALVYFLRVIYRILGRRENSVHSLAFAVVAVLLLHPYAFHSVAFQLSYSATFGILVLAESIGDRLVFLKNKNVFLKSISEAIIVSLSAYIATLPVCVAAFKELSVLAIPVNILLDIPANIMLTLCVIGLCLGFIPFLENLLISVADLFGEYFIAVVNFASRLPFAKLKLRNAGVLAVLILICYLIIYIVKAKPYKLFLKR